MIPSFKLPADWSAALSGETSKPYFQSLRSFIEAEYASHMCYPNANDIFAAFRICPLQKVKVVMLGQDPYHEPGQAQGLCFSVPDGIRIPPSLRNIFKELQADTGKPVPQNGDLTRWAQQGVLMLNATLTVREHKAGSHARQGWETFTDAVIGTVSHLCDHAAFLLWGSYAQQKADLIDASRHLLLCSAHPSPLSAYRGFFGNHHFSKTNLFLAQHGKTPINW